MRKYSKLEKEHVIRLFIESALESGDIGLLSQALADAATLHMTANDKIREARIMLERKQVTTSHCPCSSLITSSLLFVLIHLPPPHW